jgi:hypothetical protein
MANSQETAERVPPIRILGARGTLGSLGGGVVLGLVVGVALSLIFLLTLPAAALPGMLMMTVLFAVLFAPMLTFGAAGILAPAGVRREDITGVGWNGLLVAGLIGVLPGIVVGGIAGYLFLQVVTAGDAILFMFADIGGVIGALISGGMRLSRHAARRASEVPRG